MSQDTITVNRICPFCGKDSKADNVPVDNYIKWLDGELIQYALPDLTPAERKIIMTGIHDECWEKTFREDH